MTFQEKVIFYLKSIFKIEKISLALKAIVYIISVAAAIVGAYYGYKQYSLASSQEEITPPLSEVAIIKKDINEKIKFIESNFHPETIPNDLDSDKYFTINLIRDFQTVSLETCAFWSEIEKTPRHSEFKDADYPVLESINKNWIEKNSEYFLRISVLELAMWDLDSVGRLRDLGFYKVNSALYEKTDVELKKKMKVFDNFADSVSRIINKIDYLKKQYYDTSYENAERELKLFSTRYDEERDKSDYYKADLLFFDLLIKQNEMYNIGLKRFFLQKGNNNK